MPVDRRYGDRRRRSLPIPLPRKEHRKMIAAGTAVAGVVVGIVIGISVLGTGQTAPPSNVGQDEFFVVCPYTQSKSVDPIVFPGSTSMSHRHAFFGNRATSESSTGATLRAAPSTSCKAPADASAYWVPQPFLDGVAFNPKHQSAYYVNWPAPSPQVTAFPADTQLIAGDSKATAVLPIQKVRWSCGNANGTTAPGATKPYNCNPGTPSSKGDFSAARGFDGLVASVFFPACWNGAAPARTQGAAANVVYYDWTSGACPAGFPVKLPRLSVRVHMGVFNTVASDGRIRLTLAGMDMDPVTGAMTVRTDRPYYTMHADFMNGWVQTKLVQLVADCLNKAGDQSCSSIHS